MKVFQLRDSGSATSVVGQMWAPASLGMRAGASGAGDSNP